MDRSSRNSDDDDDDDDDDDVEDDDDNDVMLLKCWLRAAEAGAVAVAVLVVVVVVVVVVGVGVMMMIMMMVRCHVMSWFPSAAQALEFSPEHAELLTTLGILYLRCAAHPLLVMPAAIALL